MEKKFFNIYINIRFFLLPKTANDFHEPFNRAATQAAVVTARVRTWRFGLPSATVRLLLSPPVLPLRSIRHYQFELSSAIRSSLIYLYSSSRRRHFLRATNRQQRWRRRKEEKRENVDETRHRIQ